jgi:hypothetical protein
LRTLRRDDIAACLQSLPPSHAEPRRWASRLLRSSMAAPNLSLSSPWLLPGKAQKPSPIVPGIQIKELVVEDRLPRRRRRMPAVAAAKPRCRASRSRKKMIGTVMYLSPLLLSYQIRNREEYVCVCV